MTMEELLGEALHFPVDGEQQAIDGLRIQKTVAFRKCLHSGDGLLISKGGEDGQYVLLANGLSF
jgi:hypothetical protein